jgi:hypothetical protein
MRGRDVLRIVNRVWIFFVHRLGWLPYPPTCLPHHDSSPELGSFVTFFSKLRTASLQINRVFELGRHDSLSSSHTVTFSSPGPGHGLSTYD